MRQTMRCTDEELEWKIDVLVTDTMRARQHLEAMERELRAHQQERYRRMRRPGPVASLVREGAGPDEHVWIADGTAPTFCANCGLDREDSESVCPEAA